MSSEAMAGRMIGANFEEDTLTFEMDLGYYAAAGKYVILRDSDYADLNQQRAELLEALRPLAALDLEPDDLSREPDARAIYARNKSCITVGDVRRAIAAISTQRKEPGA